jgi:hypothetical protein
MRRLARGLAWGTLAMFLLLLLWQGVAEAIEPFWSLAPLAALRPFAPLPLETTSVGGPTLRLYADARPHVGKITALQKGLVWVAEGRELVEEGFGLGCPIVEIDGQAHLARHAEIERVESPAAVSAAALPEHWVKRFTLDTVDTPVRLLQRKYRPVAPAGVVAVHYWIYRSGVIEVEADFRQITRPWQRAYLMNEQGANTFPCYADSLGVALCGPQLGQWQTTTASQACLAAADGARRFCLTPPEGATVYYGRERYWQYNWRGVFTLAWAGVDLAVDGPRPSVRYRLTLEER